MTWILLPGGYLIKLYFETILMKSMAIFRSGAQANNCNMKEAVQLPQGVWFESTIDRLEHTPTR